jgi:hypothetical protein
VYNGSLYANVLHGQIMQVNVTTPSVSTVVSAPFSLHHDVLQLGGITYVSHTPPPPLGQPDVGLYQFNPTTGAYGAQVCVSSTMNSNPLYYPAFGGAPPYGMISAPATNPYQACLCTTDAGAIALNGGNQLCNPTVPLNITNTVSPTLDGNDIAQYVICTNTNNVQGTAVATFNALPISISGLGLVAGTAYYLVRIAGNDVGGNVDYTDICFDATSPMQFFIRQAPAATLSAIGSALCPGDCQSVNILFTAGTPPYGFSYDVLSGGVAVNTDMQTNISQNPFTFIFCVPPSTQVGPLDLQLTSISDLYCTCNQ